MKLIKRKLNELQTLNAYDDCSCSCSCSCTSCGCYCSGTTDPRNSGYSVTSYTGLGNSSSLNSGQTGLRSDERGIKR